MIPKVMAPLTGLTVLVTRPAAQGAALCEQIAQRGGTAIALPVLQIEPIPTTPGSSGDYDLVVFLSHNAVVHGAHRVTRTATTRIAAIGKATAAALQQAQLPVDIVPEADFTSEALLAHPGLDLTAGTRVLLVRGEGGRELLQQTLLARGVRVESLEVYRRVRPQLDTAERAALEARWAEEGIDVVTLTSVETLNNLLLMLSERGRALLDATPLLVPSRRVMDAAADAGLSGGVILACGADEDSLLGALAVWRARARTR